MKKLLLTVLIASAIVCGAFAKKKEPLVAKVPEGKELYVAVWDYINCSDIKIWHTEHVEKIDVMENEYIFSGWTFVGKSPVTAFKYSCTAKIKGNEDGTITAEYTDISSSYYRPRKPGSTSLTPPKPKYDQLDQNIRGNLHYMLNEQYTDEDYAKKQNEALSDPRFLQLLSRSSTPLFRKKFMEQNAIVGRQYAAKLPVTTVDESDRKEYAYRLSCVAINTFISNSIDTFTGIQSGKDNNLFFTIYTNNDAVMKLKRGAEYDVNGKIETMSLLNDGLTFNDNDVNITITE